MDGSCDVTATPSRPSSPPRGYYAVIGGGRLPLFHLPLRPPSRHPNHYVCCQGHPTCHRCRPPWRGRRSPRTVARGPSPISARAADRHPARWQRRRVSDPDDDCLHSRGVSSLHPPVFSYLILIFIITLLAKGLNLQAEQSRANGHQRWPPGNGRDAACKTMS